MKHDWHPDELAQYWTLSADEHELLANKAGVSRLSCAILLKHFQFEGRFPEDVKRVPQSIVAALGRHIGIIAKSYYSSEGSDRTQRRRRAQILDHRGFRAFSARDEPPFVAWLSGK